MSDQQSTLYRKYRPRRFSEVVGQPNIDGIRRAVAADNVPHAYLLTGIRGTGKTTTARIIAMAVNCQNPQDGEPCLECDHCQMISEGAWPEVITEVDAATNSGVNDIRNLTSTIGMSTPARKKIYIIDEVHALSSAAVTALLKNLEEPPQDVIWILATTDPQRLLPTIRSRTTEVQLRNLREAELDKLLNEIVAKEGIELSQEQIHAASVRGRGSARDAISALQGISMGITNEETLGFKLIDDALADLDVSAVMVGIQEACDSEDGIFNPKTYAMHLADIMRDALVLGFRKDAPINEDYETQIRAMAETFSAQKLIRNIDAIGETVNKMHEQLNDRILLEAGLLRIISPTASPRVDDYLDAVDSLMKLQRETDEKIEFLNQTIGRMEKLLSSGVPIAPSGAVEEQWPPASAPVEEPKREDPVAEEEDDEQDQPEAEEQDDQEDENGTDDDSDDDDDRDVADGDDVDFDDVWDEAIHMGGIGSRSRATIEQGTVEYDPKKRKVTVDTPKRVSKTASAIIEDYLADEHNIKVDWISE